MNTFLPYPDFQQSARCLDRQRLGKQRVEVYQLLRALLGFHSRWVNHPATKMWQGYIPCLCSYGLVMCQEWIARGYQDTCFGKIGELVPKGTCYSWETLPKPAWLGNEAFHAAHRSNLIRKDPIWYSKFGWTEGPNLPYIWPVNEE